MRNILAEARRGVRFERFESISQSPAPVEVQATGLKELQAIPSFVHPSSNKVGSSVVCGDDPSNLMLRRERTESEDSPAGHYGQIASGNQLIKDALIRDTFTK